MDVKAKGVKWLSLALCLTAGFSFSACSDDDEGEGGGGAGSGVAAQQMPKVADAGIQFPVTQYSDYYSDMETYTYSDGRMTGVSNSDGDRYSITSNPLVLELTDSYGASYDVTKLHNIRVNDMGFITYAEMSYSEFDEYTGNYEISGSFSFEYDAEGHLIRESGRLSNSDNSSDIWTCTYTWRDGNLMNAESSDENKDEDGIEVFRNVYTFIYGNSEWINTGSVYPFMEVNYFYYDYKSFIFHSGLFGRTTKNIPTEVKHMLYDGDDPNSPYPQGYAITGVEYNPDRSIRQIVTDEWGGSTRRYGYADYPIQQEQSGYSVTPAQKSPKAVRGIRARRMMRR